MHAEAEDVNAFFYSFSMLLRSVTLVYFMIIDFTKHFNSATDQTNALHLHTSLYVPLFFPQVGRLLWENKTIKKNQQKKKIAHQDPKIAYVQIFM
jgi:hypothetical protein